MAETDSLSGIYKHSGQYLKAVVTDNKKTKDLPLIKDSGTLIIYSPPDGTSVSGINEVYLGDTFLAGGYGFNEYTRSVLQGWVDDDVINTLSGSTWDNTQAITASFNILSGAIETKVSITGGNISNTILFFKDEYNNLWPRDINGDLTGILTSDFLQYNAPAIYKDLSIGKIVKSVTIYNNIDESIDTFYPNDAGKIYVPIGAIIKSINVSIDGKTNDSGGITGPIMTLHYNHILKDNIMQSVTGVIVASINSSLSGPGESTDFVYNIEGSYNQRKHFIVDPGENQVLFDDISCTVRESTKLLNYPLIQEKFNGLKIASPQNKIRDHQIEIDADVTIEGKHVFYYDYRNEPMQNTSLREYYNGGFIDEITELDLYYNENTPNKYIILLFPVNYEITKIELFDKTTNMVHNISGGVKHFENNIIVKGISQVTYSTITYHTQMHYDIYQIYLSNSFRSNIRLLIYTEERDTRYNSNYELLSGAYADTSLTNINDNSLTYIIDDDYNSLHWVHYSLDHGRKYLEESYTTITQSTDGE